MAREKSMLTEPIVSILGKILYALTSTVITEDHVRAVCRHVGIAAVGQGDLSSWLRKLRPEIDSPQAKLEVLSEILPEGLLAALLLVAQEFATAQANNVYHADLHANMSIQTKLLSVENAKAETDSALTAKGAECEDLAKRLAFAEETISDLTERLVASEKEKSFLHGRLTERGQKKKPKKVPAAKHSRVKGPPTSDKTILPAQIVSEDTPQASV
jgi:hypothetical protein